MVDKRIIERNMAKGLISKTEYEQYLAALADKESSCERVEIEPGEPRTVSVRE